MDDDKEVPPALETEPEKTSVTEGVTGLVTSTISSLTESMKEAAASVAAHISIPTAISNRVETAHPPVEENFDAPPMTAKELAEHAAADTQPIAKKSLKLDSVESDGEVVVIPMPGAVSPDLMSPMPPLIAVVKKSRQKSAVDTSGRITPTYDIPIPDTPLPTPKKAAKKASSKHVKEAAKKAVKKSKAKKAVKKSAAKKSAKKAAKKTKAKSSANKNTPKKVAKKAAPKKSAKKITKKKSKRSKR